MYFVCAECGSVVYVLWECSAYSSSRASFMLKLEELLGDRYADLEVLNSALGAEFQIFT